MECKKCGYKNADDSKFCVCCGSKLEKIESDIQNNVCNNCETINDKDATFCICCGKKIGSEKEEIVINEKQRNVKLIISMIISAIVSYFWLNSILSPIAILMCIISWILFLTSKKCNKKLKKATLIVNIIITTISIILLILFITNFNLEAFIESWKQSIPSDWTEM